jgi:hypothetical protein
MKKIIFILSLIAGMLVSCNKDFLQREPLSQLSPNSSFSSENQLKLYTNSFYNDIFPTAVSLYDETADNIIITTLSERIKGTRTIPVNGGGWVWGDIRNINFFLQNYQKGNLAENVSAPYVGLARFFRAYFYFDMVTTFGDVPWYSTPIEADDSTLLQKPRDSRMLVIDSVIADLDYAIANLPTGKSTDQVTKWTALAFKSRVCLFEGTWRKYHANDAFGKDSYGTALTGAAELLQQSADAADELITSGNYSIYNSSPDKAYQDLFTSPTPISGEIILARTFSSDLQVVHNVNYYTVSPSYGKPGLEKKLVNSYLMKDGTRFTDLPGYNTMQFFEEVQNRDPRLSGTIRTPGYARMGNSVPLPPDLGATTTGYQPIKFVTDPSHDKINGSDVPLPVFRYAEVLLNYAEAKAELGTLTQDDLDKSIKLLRSRVAMPDLDMVSANANPDPYLAAQYTQVSGDNKGVILEIRRERRIELMMEGFRMNDLMRWKEGHLLAEQFYGEYFPGPGSYDLDGDSDTDVVLYTDTKPPTQPGVQYLKLGSDISLKNGSGEVIVNGDIAKVFDEAKDYLFPLPTQEMLLNPELSQNPGW